MKVKLLVLITLTSIMGCSHFKDHRGPANVEETSNVVESIDAYPYRVTSRAPHDMRIINNGIAALYKRIEMIRNAKESLELEYFIFNPDSAGRIVTKELVKAAERGVKVRVLIDKSLAIFVLDEFYAKIFKDHNIELRYYNAASAAQISSVQFRNHRKLIVRDGIEAITGGRNIADEYFNLSTTFNFLDRDVWIKGDIVKTMKETFELYWKSEIVEIPKDIPTLKLLSKTPKLSSSVDSTNRIRISERQKKISTASEIIAENDEDNKILDYVMDYGEKALNEHNISQCPEVAFATDKEGASFIERLDSKDYNENYRQLRKEIAKWITTKVNNEIILDSPYFLNDTNSKEILNNLLSTNKKVTIFTNSLASTDAIYVSTVFNEEVKKYTTNPNFNAYTYKGIFSGESELYSDKIRNSEWGTHSKTIVFSDDAFMVGTFNIDNRSNFYNTEMALFCSGSPDLTNDVKDNILVRMKTSYHLNKDGKPDDGSKLLEGNSTKKKLIYYFLKIPSMIAKFLL